MILRAANALELARVFYLVAMRVSCAFMLLVVTVYRKDINRLLANMQQFVNLSNVHIN